MRHNKHSLDPWESRYARRTHGLRSSVMRDLMAITARPDVISLAGGLPDTSLLPHSAFQKIFDTVNRDYLARAFQYGPTEGVPEMREMACAVMGAQGISVSPGNVMITTGGQQVLDLFARAFIDPGDIVIAEGPTYPGAIPVFSSWQVDLRQVPLDPDGINIEDLTWHIESLAQHGEKVKYLYVIPTFHNPGGTTMPLQSRTSLLELAYRHDLLILEDDPYSMLRYEGSPLPSLFELERSNPNMNDERVVYLGTLSKILAPGVRIGWVAGPEPILARLNLAKQAADLCSPTVSQFVAMQFIGEFDWQGHVRGVAENYRHRRDAMLAALHEFFPKGSEWSEPSGGLFLWVTLPDGINTTDLLSMALERKVAFVPGETAFVDGSGTRSMRLNFSGATAIEITEGIRRIGDAAAQMLELAEQMGTASFSAIDMATGSANGGEPL